MNTVIKSIVAILLFVVVLPSIAQANDDENLSGALLWKVTGQDLTEPSYILGTHHLIAVSFADSIAGLKEAIASTKQIVGEMDMSDMGMIQAKLQQAAMMPAGESYRSMLSDKDYTTLDEGLKVALGAGLDQLGVAKPGLISTLYAIAMYSKLNPNFNAITHEPIDVYLQKMATQEGKSVVGLETAEEQIYVLFDATPLKEQAETLVCTIKNAEYGVESINLLNNYYRNGQLTEMHQLGFDNLNDPCPTSQEFQDAISTKRNNNWMGKLPQIMRDKSSLIAVGALHLSGKDGILYQLVNMGYTVEAVK